jgi:hypothetical protein
MILSWATGLRRRISVEFEVLGEYESFIEIEFQVNDQEGSLIKKEKAKTSRHCPQQRTVQRTSTTFFLYIKTCMYKHRHENEPLLGFL